jgi:hypothetical protein
MTAGKTLFGLLERFTTCLDDVGTITALVSCASGCRWVPACRFSNDVRPRRALGGKPRRLKMAKLKMTFSGFVALLTGLTLSSVAVSALAEPPPRIVEYAPGQLLIQGSNGTNHVAQLNPSDDCAQYKRDVDTLKIWHSMAQTALLAGKKMNIYSHACSDGNRHITALDIVQ